jgi:alginate O-acetyltransferase complex protein AlgI
VFFNSQVFLYLFLPAVLAGYYVVPVLLRLRGSPGRTFLNALLFAASVLFYAWGEREFVAVLLGSLAVNYAWANAIERDHRRGRSGKLPLAAAIVFDLGLLVGFKYTPFLAANLSAASEFLGGSSIPVPEVHLPIGVSFFTFQAMSYVLDVSRREVPAQRNFLLFGLYVFLFPHLIAGPIVRYRDIADQLAGRRPSLDQFAAGVRRLSAGLAKKVLLADTFAKVVDDVFKMPAHELTTSAAWLGAGCYALQIYFDFSGYSDMAIGLGKLFGFDFLENFDHPYAAKSVTEFWRRWHISLSSWFRDYVYIPLGGNRGGPRATYRNLLIVFVLCGLWHGANWTFLLWGVYHGAFLILERLGLGKLLEQTPRPARHAYTLLAVTAGWVLFRAQTLPQAGAILAAMFGFADGTYVAGDFLTNQLLVALAIGVPASGRVSPRRLFWLAPVVVGVYMAAAEIWLAGNTYSAFIYFRF